VDDVNGGGASQMPDSGGFDQLLNTITNPSDSSDQGAGKAGAGNLTGGTPEANSQFNFAGRQYKSQQDAEKAFNKVYGQYSDTQGLMKQIKGLLSDPEALQAASQDPRWAPILAKLGIQATEEELEAEDQSQPSGKVTHEMVMHELLTERARTGLEREEWAFERKLGKSLSDDEHNSIMRLIAKAPSLKFEEAYFLVNKDRLLAEAGKQAAQNAKPQGNRPKPLPRGIPGQTYDFKKPVEQMGPDEYREYLRQTPEFNELLGR
jgi:hypothetical protein